MKLRVMLPASIVGIGLAIFLAGLSLAASPETSDCDIQHAMCVRTTRSGMEVEFSITPRPVKAMQDLEFIVTLRKKGTPVTGAKVVLDLSMPGMFMGTHQPKLREAPDGTYRGRGVIPRCVTGQRTWKAFIAVAHGGQVEDVSVLFEVQ